MVWKGNRDSARLPIDEVYRGAAIVDGCMREVRWCELGQIGSWDRFLSSLRRGDRWLRLNADAVMTVAISFDVFKMCLILHPSLVLTFGYHYYWLIALRVRATILKSDAQLPERDRLRGSQCGSAYQ